MTECLQCYYDPLKISQRDVLSALVTAEDGLGYIFQRLRYDLVEERGIHDNIALVNHDIRLGEAKMSALLPTDTD